MNLLSRLLVPLALAAALVMHCDRAQAQNPPCGTVLFQSFQLQSDVHCPAGVNAYFIGADDVSIDLNGFGIYGSRGEGIILPIAIRSQGANRFTMKGPGRIAGFYMPVALEGGEAHIVSNVDMLRNTYGLVYDSTRNSGVEFSRATAFTLRSTPTAPSTGNFFVGNRGDITLHGCQTFENLVAKNQVGSPRANGLIALGDGAFRNRLESNQVMGMITLSGVRENVLEANQVEDPNQALTLIWLITGVDPCAGNATVGSVANEVVGNDLANAVEGVFVAGDLARGIRSMLNRIQGNTIRDMTSSGLRFLQLADDNDATGNYYMNMPRYVIDLGSRNLWP